MAAGTIVLTNNSTAVSGTGTTFTRDLAVNGFIVANVGGTAYTLGIKSVESDTALTLAQAYNGPTEEGNAFIDHTLDDGTEVKSGLAVDYGALTGLLVEAIKELSQKVTAQNAVIQELQAQLKDLDGLDT